MTEANRRSNIRLEVERADASMAGEALDKSRQFIAAASQILASEGWL